MKCKLHFWNENPGINDYTFLAKYNTDTIYGLKGKCSANFCFQLKYLSNLTKFSYKRGFQYCLCLYFCSVNVRYLFQALLVTHTRKLLYNDSASDRPSASLSSLGRSAASFPHTHSWTHGSVCSFISPTAARPMAWLPLPSLSLLLRFSIRPTML